MKRVSILAALTAFALVMGTSAAGQSAPRRAAPRSRNSLAVHSAVGSDEQMFGGK